MCDNQLMSHVPSEVFLHVFYSRCNFSRYHWQPRGDRDYIIIFEEKKKPMEKKIITISILDKLKAIAFLIIP